MKSRNFPEHKKIIKAHADERQAVADARSPMEQLKRLDRKFGEGKGAVKERAKLEKRMAKKAEEVVEEVKVEEPKAD